MALRPEDLRSDRAPAPQTKVKIQSSRPRVATLRGLIPGPVLSRCLRSAPNGSGSNRANASTSFRQLAGVMHDSLDHAYRSYEGPSFRPRRRLTWGPPRSMKPLQIDSQRSEAYFRSRCARVTLGSAVMPQLPILRCHTKPTIHRLAAKIESQQTEIPYKDDLSTESKQQPWIWESALNEVRTDEPDRRSADPCCNSKLWNLERSVFITNNKRI
jgi:hypothetical protein